jgi:hypothetical protein
MVPVTLTDLCEGQHLASSVLFTPAGLRPAAIEWVGLSTDTNRTGDRLAGVAVIIDELTTPDPVESLHAAADTGAMAVALLSAPVGSRRPGRAGPTAERHPDAALIDAARERSLHLVRVAGTDSAPQLARRWNTRLVLAPNSLVDDALDLQEQLARSLLANGGISGALRLALRQVPAVEAIAFTYFGECVGQRHPLAAVIGDSEALYATARRLLQNRDRAVEMRPDGSTIVAGTICIGLNPEAFLVFRFPGPPTADQGHAFRQCQIAVLLELGRQQTFRKLRRSTVEPLLRGAEDGSLSLSDLRNELRSLGFLAVEGYRVLCLTVPFHLGAAQICSLAEDALETAGTPVVGALDEHVYCIVEESGSDQARRLLEACSGRGWSGIQIGVSRVKADAVNLRVAMREAHVAAGQRLGGGDTPPSGSQNRVQRIEDLGIHAMLAPLLSSDSTSSLVVGLLRPLIERDSLEDSRLLETLIAYFDEGCHPGPAAKVLNIHRHSLANRLDRIEEVLGSDPRDPAQLLTFSLAVQLWKQMAESGNPSGLGHAALV